MASSAKAGTRPGAGKARGCRREAPGRGSRTSRRIRLTTGTGWPRSSSPSPGGPASASGARLPTERQLAADLGATRTSVRRALAVLEAEGRISREVGRGTFLRDAQRRAGGRRRRVGRRSGPGGATAVLDSAPGGPDHAGFAPADVMAIRRLLEPPAMKLVVAWATTADFEEMSRCLAGGERAASYDEFETWDLALHRSIVAASHSPLLARLYAVLEEARHGRFWGDLKRRSASRERQRAYQADHRELVAALRARDADRAVEAMRVHLARVAGHLFDETPDQIRACSPPFAGRARPARAGTGSRWPCGWPRTARTGSHVGHARLKHRGVHGLAPTSRYHSSRMPASIQIARSDRSARRTWAPSGPGPSPATAARPPGAAPRSAG